VSGPSGWPHTSTGTEASRGDPAVDAPAGGPAASPEAAARGTAGAAPPDEATGIEGPAQAPSGDDVDAKERRAAADLTVEDLLTLVETLTAERDASLEARAWLQAEFENYRKRVAKQEQEQVARAAEGLVTKLLPTLDAFEGALTHAAEGVEPLWNSLWPMLEREGLVKLAPTGEAFDPNLHEAVAHEPGEGGHPTVAEVFRSGYAWKGRVLRPAMVKVRD
jgi:molecular chaperone GrpE